MAEKSSQDAQQAALDKRLDKISSAFIASQKKGTLSAKKANACDLWKKIVPFIDKTLPILRLFKPNWATALQGLRDSMDDACPGATTEG